MKSDFLNGGGRNYLSVKKLVFILSLFVSLTVSCKRDETLDIRNTEYISFKFSDEELSASGIITKGICDTLSYEITDWDYTGEESDTDVQTKGTLTESLSGELGLFMLQVPGKTSVTDTLTKNQSLSVSGSSVTSSSPLLWKDRTVGSKLISFAYAPYSDTVKVRNKGDKPYIMYTVPDTVTKQKDILYAVDTTIVPSSSSDRKPIDLKFRHALTAVQFKMNFDTLNIKSIKLVGVANIGKLFAGNVEVSGNEDFEISLDPGKKYKKDSLLNAKENTFIMLPQAFSSSDTAKIVITFKNNSTLSASLKDQVWPAGKKVTYTLKKAVPEGTVEYIYFDFTAGDIILTNSSYSGYVYVTNKDSNAVSVPVTGTPTSSTKYYIYQSAPDSIVNKMSPVNKNIKSSKTGYSSAADIGKKIPTLPQYSTIEVDGKSWGEYITNNTDPAAVLAKWNSFDENFLEPVPHRILIKSDSDCVFDVTLDRIYSRYFPYVKYSSGVKSYEGIQTTTQRTDHYGGITIGAPSLDSYPDGKNPWVRSYKEKVTLRLKGNNYFSHINYAKDTCSTKGYDGYLKITSEKGDGISEGTLTVTLPKLRTNISGSTYLNIGMCALIGGGSPKTGNNEWRQVCELYFNGGIVFAGIEKIRDSKWDDVTNLMSCIGSINSDTRIFINGGIVTAVAYGPGPAIGGGSGWNSTGGPGNVTINGGTVYAHCFGVYNETKSFPIKGTAIGGGSCGNGPGQSGTVTINGGNVYAYSVGGAAVGGGTTANKGGGNADITINGGNLYATSLSGSIGDYEVNAGTAIGGGSAGIDNGTIENTFNGGYAKITINGGMIHTGSVGGGGCANSTGKIGRAEVIVSGGETSAQFLLVKDPAAETDNSFTMTGGTIRNSSTSDNTYKKVQNNGGAVYMESGKCSIEGGTISKCSATLGGAVYMNGGEFTMSGGTISDCKGEKDGGAVYIEGGDAKVSGGEIYHNIASKGNGGGVYISGGNFEMTGGKINNNASDTDPVMVSGKYYGGNGGGIFVTSTSTDPIVKLLGGEITYNAADRDGGGLCVDMSEATEHKATITIGNEAVAQRDTLSPNIRLNSAALSGGGMDVQGKGSNITIYSGTVKGNVSAFVKNEDIRNDGGTVELVGKNEEGKTPQVNVQYNTITFYANNGNDPEPYDEQRVITSTNSLLQPTAKALAFELEFYHIASWNTKRDGTGTKYTADGRDPNTGKSAIMNITSDVSLYAQWEKN